MPIKSIFTNPIGQAGILPTMVFINTDDTQAQVLVTGYLSSWVQDGLVALSSYQLALVNTSDKGPSWYNIVIQNEVYSLTLSSPGTVTSILGTPNEIVATLTLPNQYTISISPTYPGQTSITTLGVVTTGTWSGTTVAILHGGTGATTAPNALTNLGALPIAGGTMTGNLILNTNPTLPLQAATKQYVDSIASGFTFKSPAYAGSTGTLNSTYNNGVAGVGATLTNAGVQAAFSIDGTSPPINSRILIKNQSSPAENGIYTLTTVGTGASNWVLTRATDFNTPATMVPGSFIIVNNGTVNANSAWIETAAITVVGTDPVVWSQFGTLGVQSVTGTAGRITSTGGMNPVIDIDPLYVGQASITTLGVITTGTWDASVISLQFGGTSANLSAAASNGGIVWSNATQMQILAGTATARQMLQSGASSTPAWSTATWPATTTQYDILYSSGTNVVGQIATAVNATLVTDVAGIPSISQTLPSAVQLNITSVGALSAGSLVAGFTPVTVPIGGTGATSFTQNGMLYGNGVSAIGVTSGMTDGQIVIGSSIGVPAAAALIAGPNVTIVNGNNTITISALSGSDVVSYTGITNASTPYTAISTDYYISCDVTAGVISVLLPNAPTTGRTFVIKDKVGLAATSNITITTVGGAVTIDGATTFVMNTAYEAANVIFNGTSYEIW
jgi:hypothetical protein